MAYRTSIDAALVHQWRKSAVRRSASFAATAVAALALFALVSPTAFALIREAMCVFTVCADSARHHFATDPRMGVAMEGFQASLIISFVVIALCAMAVLAMASIARLFLSLAQAAARFARDGAAPLIEGVEVGVFDVTLTEDGIEMRSAVFRRFVAWSAVARMVARDGAVALELDEGPAVVLPADGFDDEALAFMRARVAARRPSTPPDFTRYLDSDVVMRHRVAPTSPLRRLRRVFNDARVVALAPAVALYLDVAGMLTPSGAPIGAGGGHSGAAATAPLLSSTPLASLLVGLLLLMVGCLTRRLSYIVDRGAPQPAIGAPRGDSIYAVNKNGVYARDERSSVFLSWGVVEAVRDHDDGVAFILSSATSFTMPASPESRRRWRRLVQRTFERRNCARAAMTAAPVAVAAAAPADAAAAAP